SSQVFLGEAMTYHLDTDEFTLNQALIITNDPKAKEEVIRKVLGFTSKEFEFKAAQTQKLAEIGKAKESMRKLYGIHMRQTPKEQDELVERYTLLLEKEKLIRDQEFPHFSHLNEDRRESYKRRRKYWQESQAKAIQPS